MYPLSFNTLANVLWFGFILISFMTIPVELMYFPVNRLDLYGADTGLTDSALEKFIASCAKLLILGVMAFVSPAYPSTSALIWSAKTNTRFGRSLSVADRSTGDSKAVAMPNFLILFMIRLIV